MSRTFERSNSRNSNSTEFTCSQTECCKYVIFLALFTLIVVLGRGLNESNYYVTMQMQELLKENCFQPTAPLGLTRSEKCLNTIDQQFEIYDYFTKVAIPVLLPDTNANNEPIQDPSKLNLVSGQNKIVRSLRLRQLRVKKVECLIVSSNWECFPDWSSDYESTLTLPPSANIAEIKWKSSSDLNEKFKWVGLRSSYPASGFIIDLPANKTQSLAIIAQLRADNYFDRSTRLIVLDFNVYNPSLNLHSVGRLAFECAGAGSVIPTLEVKTWRFLRYDGRQGKSLIAFEIIFVAFVLYFTYEEIHEFYIQGWEEYKIEKWNFVDILNLIFFYITIILRLLDISDYANKRNKLLSITGSEYENLRVFQRELEYESYMQMVNGFFLYIKMFKYLTFSRRFRFLFAMLSRSSNDLLIFCIVLFVFFLAFGMVGFLAFSTDVNDFRSFGHSVINLVRFTVTEPPYLELANSNKNLGSIYFVFWGVLMLLILANVFIAILADAYSDVIADMGEEDNNIFHKLLENTKGNVRRYTVNVIQRFSLNSKFSDVDMNQDGKITVAELEKMANISTIDAKSLLQRFDTDNDGIITEDEYNEEMVAAIAMESCKAHYQKSLSLNALNNNRKKNRNNSSTHINSIDEDATDSGKYAPNKIQPFLAIDNSESFVRRCSSLESFGSVGNQSESTNANIADIDLYQNRKRDNLLSKLAFIEQELENIVQAMIYR